MTEVAILRRWLDANPVSIDIGRPALLSYSDELLFAQEVVARFH